MKTVISVPDDLLAAAEDLADRLGMSRSQLFSVAVAEFVASHQDAEVTRKLDEIYGQERAGVDPVLQELQRQSLASAWWSSSTPSRPWLRGFHRRRLAPRKRISRDSQ